MPDRYLTVALSGVIEPAEMNIISREAGGFVLPFNASVSLNAEVESSIGYFLVKTLIQLFVEFL
jgi:hypothetical protein